MKRFLFPITLILFLLVWVSIVTYTVFALLSPELPMTPMMLLAVFGVLNILVWSTFIAWWRFRPHKSYQERFFALSIGIFVFTFYIIFAFYYFFAIELTNFQLRYSAFLFIIETIVVGVAVGYPLARNVRFIDRLLQNKNVPPQKATYGYISRLPLRLAGIMFVVYLVGYIISVLQFHYLALLPPVESFKVALSALATIPLGTLVMFLFAERTLAPAITQLEEQSRIIRTGKPVFMPLIFKIMAVTTALALSIVVLLGDMLHGHAQLLLEKQLQEQLFLHLGRIQTTARTTTAFFSPEEFRTRFGENGVAAIVETRNKPEPAISYIYGMLPSERIPLLFTTHTDTETIFIERHRAVVINGAVPLDESRMVVGAMHLSDFNQDVNAILTLVLFSILIVSIIAILTSYFLTQSILFPLHQIREGAVRIGKGNFLQPIVAYSTDEFRNVSEALNDASSRLQISYDNLEQEIRNRTTVIRQKNKELEDANVQLLELDQMKSHFISIAAHQLRTPLSSIKWTLHLFLQGDFGTFTDEQKKYIEETYKVNEQLIQLVNEFLNISRVERGTLHYIFKPIDIVSLIENLVYSSQELAKKKDINLQYNVPKKPVEPIELDSDKIKIAVQNIIDNAITYTPPGGTITVSVQEQGSAVHVSIADTGVGIEEKYLKRLFTRFFRTPRAIRIVPNGSGLGLFIAKNMVENHGGSITVHSEVNKGTTFTIALPRAIVHTQNEEEDEPPPQV